MAYGSSPFDVQKKDLLQGFSFIAVTINFDIGQVTKFHRYCWKEHPRPSLRVVSVQAGKWSPQMVPNDPSWFNLEQFN